MTAGTQQPGTTGTGSDAIPSDSIVVRLSIKHDSSDLVSSSCLAESPRGDTALRTLLSTRLRIPPLQTRRGCVDGISSPFGAGSETDDRCSLVS